MKWITVLICLALVIGVEAVEASELTAEVFESVNPRAQSPASGLVNRVLNMLMQFLLYINNCVYRLTGGMCGVEAYCF